MVKDKFYAITKQNKILNADTWEELLAKTPLRKEIKMYVVFLYDKVYKTQFGKQLYWPQILIVNRKREHRYYRQGILKVKHIIVDGSFYLKGFQFDLENCITQELLTVYSCKNDTWKDNLTINDFYNTLFDKLTEENKKLKQNICK